MRIASRKRALYPMVQGTSGIPERFFLEVVSIDGTFIYPYP